MIVIVIIVINAKWKFRTIKNALCSSGGCWSAQGASCEVSISDSASAV